MANITRARGAGVATMLLLDRGGAHGDAASAAHSCSAWLHPDHALCCFSAAGCFFAQKVYNAQRAGADVVLIADNRDEPLITMAEPSDHPVRTFSAFAPGRRAKKRFSQLFGLSTHYRTRRS